MVSPAPIGFRPRHPTRPKASQPRAFHTRQLEAHTPRPREEEGAARAIRHGQVAQVRKALEPQSAVPWAPEAPQGAALAASRISGSETSPSRHARPMRPQISIAFTWR